MDKAWDLDPKASREDVDMMDKLEMLERDKTEGEYHGRHKETQAKD